MYTALTSLACVGCRHKKQQSKQADARRATLEDIDPFMLGNYESDAPAPTDWQPSEHPVVKDSSKARSEDLEATGKDGASETTSASASNGEADAGSSSSSSSSHSSNTDVASQEVSASVQTAEQCLRPRTGSRPEIDPPQEVV